MCAKRERERETSSWPLTNADCFFENLPGLHKLYNIRIIRKQGKIARNVGPLKNGDGGGSSGQGTFRKLECCYKGFGSYTGVLLHREREREDVGSFDFWGDMTSTNIF